MREKPELNLSLLFCREGDGRWLAHCLEFDIVETADSLEEAREAMIDVIRAHVAYAFEHDNLAHLFHYAPEDAWVRFWSAEKLSPITIDLTPEDDGPHHIPPIAVQAASLANAHC